MHYKYELEIILDILRHQECDGKKIFLSLSFEVFKI